jgi:hypothetical protein
VAQVYNPSCSGGRDQENLGSKPAWANSWKDYLGKKSITKKKKKKKGQVEWLKVKALNSSPRAKKKCS